MNTDVGQRPGWILPVIVIAQFACTSLWFAGNAVLPDLRPLWQLSQDQESMLLAAVQIGFVVGTLTFAILSISDRFQAPQVFFCCAILGAAANASMVVAQGFGQLVAARVLTGFFLAGIYPVGMKIAASWCAAGLGRALGYLVGALVLGTALPHLLRGLGADVAWTPVLLMCSAAAVAGGLAILLLVPTGPHLPARSPFRLDALPAIFRVPRLRAAAFGYFGHMWELYALWAFLPLLIQRYTERAGLADANVSLAVFGAIAVGAVGCVVGGELVIRYGSARVALFQLLVSGIACLTIPLAFHAGPTVFLVFLAIWGVTVVGDSPQFSSLVGANAPREYVGTAFTIVNCIGFAITAVSIQLIGHFSAGVPIEYLLLVLAAGPLVGLISARPLLRPG